MAASVTEVLDGKGPLSANRPPHTEKQTSTSPPVSPSARFFLAKAGSSGASPALDRECATEAEAMAEAFKTGASYCALTEYRVAVDCSGKQPQFKKEVVKKNH
jgi:hypothetical protein